MKTFFSTVATILAVLLVGCTKENSAELTPTDKGETLTIGLPETKTYLGPLVEGTRKVYWSEGDQIKANEHTSTAITISEQNAGVASFNFANGLLEYPCNILYPAEIWKDASTVTLPAVQAAATGSYGVDAAPMVAVADGENSPVLKHLIGVIRLRIKAAGYTHTDLRLVEFRGNNNEQVSGDFNIDYASATLTDKGSTATKDLKVSAKVAQILTTENAIDLFVVVPAREYANGFTVTFVDKNGHYMEKSKSTALTLAKGEIYAMPELAFEPTGTKFDVEISSAE